MLEKLRKLTMTITRKKKKGKVNQKKYERAKDLAIKFWPIK